MVPGLYLTFLTQGDSLESGLPPVGPLENVVIYDRLLLADRKSVPETDEFPVGSPELEAELELRRAMGKEPGGARPPDLRVRARGGVYIRFVSFGDAAERDPLPEFGPYSMVVLGRDSVEADGKLLATRTETTHQLWELTRAAGRRLEGAVRPDLAFRTRSTGYHPKIRPARVPSSGYHPKIRPARVPRRAATATKRRRAPPRRARLAEAPGPPPARAPTRTRPQQPDLVAPPDVAEESARTFLERVGAEPLPQPQEPVVLTTRQKLEWAQVAWRLPLITIGALLLLVVAFSVPAVRGLVLPGSGPSVNVVGIGKGVTGTQWEYKVVNVRRTTTAGDARAQGVYVIVQVAATNRGQAGAQLWPRDFSLIAAEGGQYLALPEADPVYQSPDNAASPFVWTISYPVGRPVATQVIFDVSPSITRPQLVIAKDPGTRVSLE